MAGRPKGSHDVADKVRKAFFRAVDNIKEKGGITGLCDIFEELIVNDPKGAFEVLAKFTPKEMMIEQVNPDEKGVFLAQPMATEEWDKQFGNDETIN